MRWGTLAILTSLALVGGVATLFVVQNSSRTTQLSLDLGVKAAQLGEPISVPALIGICLGLGVVLGAGPLLVRNYRLASRVRDLESRAALDQAMSRDPFAPGSQPGGVGAKEPGAW